MCDDEFDLTFRNHRRPAVVLSEPVPNLQIYKSVKVATTHFINKEYLEAIAMSWIMIKSDYNFTFSPYIIGYCYDNGIQLKKNISLAIKFYLLSAHSGLYMSQLRLAEIYNLQAFENPQNKKFYFNMSYAFYTFSYKHGDASFYDKLKIAYVLTKIRIFMYINRIKVDDNELILVDPNDIKHILVHECNDLDNISNIYTKN